jgi:hypothetical protein
MPSQQDSQWGVLELETVLSEVQDCLGEPDPGRALPTPMDQLRGADDQRLTISRRQYLVSAVHQAVLDYQPDHDRAESSSAGRPS